MPDIRPPRPVAVDRKPETLTRDEWMALFDWMDFRDPLGHRLTNCVNFQWLVREVVRLRALAESPARAQKGVVAASEAPPGNRGLPACERCGVPLSGFELSGVCIVCDGRTPRAEGGE